MLVKPRCISTIALAAMLGWPTAVRGDLSPVKHQRTRCESHPGTWKEMAILNAWKPSRYASREGYPLHSNLGPEYDAEDGFGWFCYQILVDPGLMAPGFSTWGLYRLPVSEELHAYFTVIAQACTRNRSFGEALSLLFDSVDANGNRLPFWPSSVLHQDQAGPLSPEARAARGQVAKIMRRVMGSDAATPEIKATAHLIVALTEGNQFPEDSVSMQNLAQIPTLYPDMFVTCFVSQYYLYRTLVRRGKVSEADEIAAHTLARYADHPVLSDLAVYKELRAMRDIARHERKMHRPIAQPF